MWQEIGLEDVMFMRKDSIYLVGVELPALGGEKQKP
jgi:hypothetical protein